MKMEFLFFSNIKMLTGYKDNRSVKTFLQELCVPVFYIGRRAAVDKTLFETRMEKRYRLIISRRQYVPTLETEKQFQADLQKLFADSTTGHHS